MMYGIAILVVFTVTTAAVPADGQWVVDPATKCKVQSDHWVKNSTVRLERGV